MLISAHLTLIRNVGLIEVNMRLLMSVFITPNFLTKYRTPAITDLEDSSLSRVNRFLSMVESMKTVPWRSVDIYLSIASEWKEFEPAIIDFVEMTLGSKVRGSRLDTVAKWRDALRDYQDKNLVLLQTNDDHILLPGKTPELLEFEREIESAQLNLGAVTHFPEYWGLANREKKHSSASICGHRAPIVDDLIGTVLIKGELLKSLFDDEQLESEMQIVRPDNPFGKSVSLGSMRCLVPKSELMRHMDGYSHAFMYRPLPPLRSNVHLAADGRDITVSDWSFGLWPKSLVGYRGKGVDIYRDNHLTSKSILESIRIDVARQVTKNSLSVRFVLDDLNPRFNKSFSYRLILSILVFGNPIVMRNYFDLIVDKLGCKRWVQQSQNSYISERFRFLYSRLGLCRSFLVISKEKLWFLFPRNRSAFMNIVAKKLGIGG